MTKKKILTRAIFAILLLGSVVGWYFLTHQAVKLTPDREPVIEIKQSQYTLRICDAEYRVDKKVFFEGVDLLARYAELASKAKKGLYSECAIIEMDYSSDPYAGQPGRARDNTMKIEFVRTPNSLRYTLFINGRGIMLAPIGKGEAHNYGFYVTVPTPTGVNEVLIGTLR